MNLMRRNGCHRPFASVLAWALAAVVIHGPKQAAGQSSHHPATTSSEVSASTTRAQDGESHPQLTPQEIRRYDEAQTLIDWTPQQIHDLPELRELQPAESQQDLPAILREVGERVSVFFEDFPNMTATEQVRSGPCGAELGDKCRVTSKDKFNYLVLTPQTEGDQLFGEYRTDAKGRPIDYLRLKPGQVLTYGFTTWPLQHFHPQNRMASRFRYFGRQMVDGVETDVVGFAEIPGKYPRPSELRHGSAVVPLVVQGLAWIDVTNHQILRIETYLLAPPEAGLERETTQIEFSAIQLRQASTPFWLPTEVVVDVWLDHRHFRNIHRYSDFKLFRVETRIGPVEEK